MLRHDSRGNASMEFAIIIPVVLLLIFGTLQLVTHLNARNIAQAASAACAENARALGSGPAQGRQSAANVLNAGGSLTETSVSVDSTATQVTCTVRGSVNRIMPIGPKTVEMTAVMPKERVS
ncbi:MAG: pilus assembly protein [Propionibacteriales bacterium]|nr:pilus assembly protein [Propionibacteriales bacterium]